MGSQHVLVSVGIPTYNRPKTLERTLNCLVNQTYRNIEIIVSDNCSTDMNVKNILEKYALDNRVLVIQQPENRGAVFNMNTILEKATGDYFMRLNDDDWLDSNYIESCFNFLIKNPDYIGAYGVAKLYSKSGEFVQFDSAIDMNQVNPSERIKYYFKNVLNNGCFYGLVKKTDADSNLQLSNLIAIDWMVIARIAFLGKFKMIENTNSYITLGGASSNIDEMTKNFKMPVFTRVFPYLQISINVFQDILWGSPVYRKYNFFKRFALAKACFFITYRKHNVGKQLWPGIKKMVKVKLGLIKI